MPVRRAAGSKSSGSYTGPSAIYEDRGSVDDMHPLDSQLNDSPPGVGVKGTAARKAIDVKTKPDQ